MIQFRTLFLLAASLGAYQKNLTELLAPAPRPARMNFGGRCDVCLEYAVSNPCTGCRRGNRSARLAEGWDRSRDTLTPEDVRTATSLRK